MGRSKGHTTTMIAITLPNELIEKIDFVRKRKLMSRSGYIREVLVRHFIHKRLLPAISTPDLELSKIPKEAMESLT